MTNAEVFEGKDLADLLRDIHDNALDKRRSINSVITTLTDMIRSSDDAIVLAPILREFFDVGVKNDDQVIKIATIVQRMAAIQSGPTDGELLTEAEKDQLLLNTIGDVNSISRTVDTDLGKVTLKLEAVNGTNS